MKAIEPYIIQLPFPPSINNNWGRRYNGEKYLLKPVRDFRKNVVIAHRLASAHRRRDFPIVSPVELFIELYYKDNRHTDIDNRLKPLIDAMEAARIFENDYLVFMIKCVRFKPQLHEYKNGACIVKIVAHEQETNERLIKKGEKK